MLVSHWIPGLSNLTRLPDQQPGTPAPTSSALGLSMDTAIYLCPAGLRSARGHASMIALTLSLHVDSELETQEVKEKGIQPSPSRDLGDAFSGTSHLNQGSPEAKLGFTRNTGKWEKGLFS